MHGTCPLLMTTTDSVQRLGDARCFLAVLSLPSRPDTPVCACASVGDSLAGFFIFLFLFFKRTVD